MRETVESNIQHDKNIIEINFDERNGVFSMEIIARDGEQAVELAKWLNGLRGLRDTENPTKQNFDIASNKQRGTVTLTGNIFNAVTLLKETDLISANLAEAILANSKVSNFLETTKSFVLPGNEVHVEKSSSSNRIEAALQETYAEALSKLQPEEMQQAMSELARILASKGTSVEINVQENPRKSPAVY